MTCSPLLTTALLSVFFCGQTSDQDAFDALIRKLGSPRYVEREFAAKQLRNLGLDAVPALERATKSSKKEIAIRAAQLLTEFQLRPLNRLNRFIKEGKIDLAIELLSRWPKGKQEQACWQATIQLITKLNQAQKRETTRDMFREALHSPYSKGLPLVLTGKEITKGQTKSTSSFLFVRAGKVNVGPEAKFALRNAIFASDSAIIRKPRNRSVVFAGGSVHLQNVRVLIIVSDGDVTIEGYGSECVIISRGNITCDVMDECHAIAGQSVRTNKEVGSTIVENCTKPLDFFQFFDPAREGITVENADNNVRVTKLTEGKLFRKAGVRTGDRITTVNGKAVKTTEAFRKVLRKHFAWEEAMTFRVQRDGKSLEIAVPRPK